MMFSVRVILLRSLRVLRVSGIVMRLLRYLLLFFFQAEDGIRDTSVTGVQTCALPICHPSGRVHPSPPRSSHTRGPNRLRRCSPQSALAVPVAGHHFPNASKWSRRQWIEIGRASCRESVHISLRAATLARTTCTLPEKT